MAIAFIVALFFFKNKTEYKNKFEPVSSTLASGLTYGNETLEKLVNKDTDNDGILDWEEGLWGTDPAQKETVQGTPDGATVAKLKAEQSENRENREENSLANQDEENLTQTDKFSRELFTTIAALNQNGTMDEATIEALSASLAEQIQKSEPEKVFTLKDIKVIDNESKEAIQKYNDTLLSVYQKYSTAKGVPEILEKLVADEENMSILKELEPIITQTKKIVNELLKIEVPQSLSALHLELINISQRLSENIGGIKLLDNDPIVTISAMNQYWENAVALEAVANKLSRTIWEKLNN